MTDDTIRLSKRVAEIAACSRSEAEMLIEGGWVQVNGRVVEEPGHRVSTQTVHIDPDARPADRLSRASTARHSEQGRTSDTSCTHQRGGLRRYSYQHPLPPAGRRPHPLQLCDAQCASAARHAGGSRTRRTLV